MQELKFAEEPEIKSNDFRTDDQRRYPRAFAKVTSVFYTGPWYNRTKVRGRIINWSQTGIEVEADPMTAGFKNKVVNFTVRYPSSSGATNVTGTIVRKNFSEAGAPRYGIRFLKTLPAFIAQKKTNFRKNIVTLFTLLLICALAWIKADQIRWFWYGPFFHFYSLMTAVFIGSRFFISSFYKEPEDQGFFPAVSIIIAVKNEEANIQETIDRCFSSRYSKDRLEVIVIDDGSDDGTWNVMQKAAARHDKLKIIKFAQNKGKRHAMAVGAKEASGEILVYVDSDSFVEPDGIYQIVQPFFDAGVGAVAGHTRVRIENNNPISKMESVRYFVSHQLFKASESVFGTVTCCPGAFSAYRKKLVLEAIPTWLHQKFFGKPATFGDDRSLTNHILKKHRVLYHAGAVCYTFVPSKWGQFFRQQLRWKKSWAREATIAGRIMLFKNPIAAISFYLGIAITLLSPLVFLRAAILGPIFLGTTALPYLTGLLLVYLALCIFYFLHVPRSHWVYGLIFAVIYLTFMCWQTYYAILTVNRTHWGTR